MINPSRFSRLLRGDLQETLLTPQGKIPLIGKENVIKLVIELDIEKNIIFFK